MEWLIGQGACLGAGRERGLLDGRRVMVDVGFKYLSGIIFLYPEHPGWYPTQIAYFILRRIKLNQTRADGCG